LRQHFSRGRLCDRHLALSAPAKQTKCAAWSRIAANIAKLPQLLGRDIRSNDTGPWLSFDVFVFGNRRAGGLNKRQHALLSLSSAYPNTERTFTETITNLL
jgi:hypothetical protein